MLLVLVLCVVFQEVKLGMAGPLLSSAISGEAGEGTGLPFVQEYAVGMMLGLYALRLLVAGRDLSGAASARKVAAGLCVWGTGVILVTVLLGVPVGEGSWGNVRMLVEGLITFFIVSDLGWRRREVWLILVVFVLVACFHAMVVWLSYVNPSLLPFGVTVLDSGGDPRFSGLFLEPSRAGLVFAIAFVLAAANVLDIELARLVRVFWLVGLLVLGVGLLLTQTRGSLLAVAAGMVYLALAEKKLARVGLFVATVGSGLFLWSGSSGVEIVRIGLSRFLADDSAGGGVGRLQVYSFVGEMVARYPLGSGAGALFPESGAQGIPHAHNMYLQMAVMFGIPGAVLFLGFIVATVSSKGAASRSWSGVRSARTLVVLRAALLVNLVALMTEPLLITNVGLWFWVIAGFMVSPSEGLH